MKKTETYNAAIYARLSKESPRAGDSVSIKSQVDMLTKYVADNGWNHVATYTDDGVSGTTFDRPAFNEMMSRVRKGEINVVVVKDMSRFGRNYLETATYIDEIFPDLNCRLISVNENYDSLRDGDDMMVVLRNIFNDFYARDTQAPQKGLRQGRSR